MGQDLRKSGVDRRAALALLAAGAAAAICPARAQTATGRRFRRGGSIHTMMNWADVNEGAARYVFPAFRGDRFQIDGNLLRIFRGAGLDFIRLTVDPGPFLQASTEAQRAQLDQTLLARCDELLAAGFDVIVDFHPTWQVASTAPEKILTDPALFATYRAMIGRAALRLAALPADRLALEVMNEPPFGYDGATAARWRDQALALHGAVRDNAPSLPVVLSGSASGGARGLLDMDARAFRDDNLYWSFHFYDAHAFTHQGVRTSQENMRHYRYLAELPYPSDAGNAGIIAEAIETLLRLDKSLGQSEREEMRREALAAARAYLSSGFGERSIAHEFDRVAKWAKEAGVPNTHILLGEFGVMRTTYEQPGARSIFRERWMRDVRLAAETRGFGWALWDINDTTMGLVERRGSTALHEGTLTALGLGKRHDGQPVQDMMWRTSTPSFR